MLRPKREAELREKERGAECCDQRGSELRENKKKQNFRKRNSSESFRDRVARYKLAQFSIPGACLPKKRQTQCVSLVRLLSTSQPPSLPSPN